MKGNAMTPLEMARARAKEISCATCPKSERVDGTLYCRVDGRIIMPQFEKICCCRGKKFKEMTKIYGYSDDDVVIENSDYEENEIGCYDSDVRICFVDGTVIRVGYPKEGAAIWWIEVEKQGTADQRLEICNDEEAKVYSDIFFIDSEVKSHSVIEQKYNRE